MKLPITRIKLIIKFIINPLIDNTKYWCTSRQAFIWAERHWLESWVKLGAIQKWCSSYSHYSIIICIISIIDKNFSHPVTRFMNIHMVKNHEDAYQLKKIHFLLLNMTITEVRKTKIMVNSGIYGLFP